MFEEVYTATDIEGVTLYWTTALSGGTFLS